MESIKNRYDFVFLFDVKDGNPNGDPDFDNMPRIDEETNHGLVTDVCIKRKVRNYVQLLKGLESPYDIFIRDGNVLNPIIDAKRKIGDTAEPEDQKKAISKGREEICKQYFDIRTFGAVMSTSDEKEDSNEKGEGKEKGKKKEKRIKGLGVVRGPVQFTFSRSIDPVNAKPHSITRCCITKEADADNNNTIGGKNTVAYGLYRMHGFISATDAAKCGFTEDDANLLFEALINAFEHDRSAARGEMNPRALVVFKHKSHLGNARSGQLFDLVKVEKNTDVEFPRSFSDYSINVAWNEKDFPGVEMIQML